MAKDFAPSFRNLERDIERHIERFGRKGQIMGSPALFGLDKSRRAMFDAYVEAGKDAEIAQWLSGHWYYMHGTNPFFDEFVDILVGKKAAARLGALWRHVWFVQLENYALLKLYPAEGPAGNETLAARERLLTTVSRWKTAVRTAGDPEAAKALEAGAYEDPDTLAGPLPKPDKRKIDEDLFWSIIGEPRESTAEHALEIAARLECFPASQIKAFDKILRARMQALNHYDLWALAYLLKGGCSDDEFEAFRAWIVMQGPEAAALALGNPVTFLERSGVSAGASGEGLLLVPRLAWFRRTGRAMPPGRLEPGKTAGAPWDEANVETAYPDIAAKCTSVLP
ncbi:MAG: DUF4240 domain-containing protein [Beijerinckiaceae bacterium]